MSSRQQAPYKDPAYIDHTNAELGLTETPGFVRLDRARRDHIIRRVAEWRLFLNSGFSVQPGNEKAAEELFDEMLHVIRLLVSDHLAREAEGRPVPPWYLRLLGFK